MPAPTTYTEETLAAFMIRALSTVASVLNWNDVNDLRTAIEDTLLAYGVDDIADATDIKKLRALARREAWRAAMTATAVHFDFAADGGNFKRSQIHAQAKEQYEQAHNDALDYDDGYSVEVDRLIHIQDPYHYIEDDEDRVYP